LQFNLQLKDKKIKVLIATHNKNKLSEFKKIFKKSIVKPISLESFTKIEPEEYGSTFHQNALIKARFASSLVNYSHTTIADDSGICIQNLNNKPGIFSSRWAINNDYSLAYEMIVKKLNAKGLSIKGQKAKFICVLALINKDKKESLYEGILEGSLTFPPKGSLGFGYDPIFIPNNNSKTLAEISTKQKNTMSHRKKAITKLLENKLFKNIFSK
tara:strand:+ start:746 stop:1387 length:642 start_codon:yes stop_codon:yes gene_type:complete